MVVDLKPAPMDAALLDLVRPMLMGLLRYCQDNDWAGYDPYDALNSRLFKAVPFLNHKLPRLIATQALKRCIFNPRPLLLIPKTHNAKAIALCLTAYLKLSAFKLISDEEIYERLIDLLVSLRPQDSQRWAWGYSFPWQGRSILVPAGSPNLVSTTFVGNALCDAFESRKEPRLLEMAQGAAAYLVDELYWTAEDGVAGFCYPRPGVRSQVHNANFLAAAFLARFSFLSGEGRFLQPALQAARHSASRQLPDGSWFYGEAAQQGWIDNFHTGFNLCALQVLGRYAKTDEFELHLQKGFKFYCDNFFRADGAAKYFHNGTYPIDVHSVAQSLITLAAGRALDARAEELLGRVVHWAARHLWDPRGFFYYRVLRLVTIRTSFMRWSQAWMLLALASVYEVCQEQSNSGVAAKMSKPAKGEVFK